MLTLNILFRANRAWRRGVPVELSSVSERERGGREGGRERENGGKGRDDKNDKLTNKSITEGT